jgi:hypothetical protein
MNCAGGVSGLSAPIPGFQLHETESRVEREGEKPPLPLRLKLLSWTLLNDYGMLMLFLTYDAFSCFALVVFLILANCY